MEDDELFLTNGIAPNGPPHTREAWISLLKHLDHAFAMAACVDDDGAILRDLQASTGSESGLDAAEALGAAFDQLLRYRGAFCPLPFVQIQVIHIPLRQNPARKQRP